MKALVITRLGGPDALELQQVSEPVVGPGEVLVEVEAGGLNFADIMTTQGGYPGAPKPPPGPPTPRSALKSGLLLALELDDAPLLLFADNEPLRSEPSAEPVALLVVPPAAASLSLSLSRFAAPGEPAEPPGAAPPVPPGVADPPRRPPAPCPPFTVNPGALLPTEYMLPNENASPGAAIPETRTPSCTWELS